MTKRKNGNKDLGLDTQGALKNVTIHQIVITCACALCLQGSVLVQMPPAAFSPHGR